MVIVNCESGAGYNFVGRTRHRQRRGGKVRCAAPEGG